MRWADAAWECAGWDQANLLSVLIVCKGAQDPSMPHTLPPPSETQHNHVTKHCSLHFLYNHIYESLGSQNSFFLQRPTLYFLCTLQSPLSLHQTHSNFSCFISVVCHFPRHVTVQRSCFWMFLILSYLSFHGLWQSRCNVPGVLLIVELCLLFWSCWLFLSLVCILCVFFFLKPVYTFISLFFKKKNNLPSLINLCQSGKTQIGSSHLLPLSWSQEKTRQCKCRETKPKLRHGSKTFWRSACLDQQNLGKSLGLLCLTGVLWSLEPCRAQLWLTVPSWSRILSLSLLLRGKKWWISWGKVRILNW